MNTFLGSSVWPDVRRLAAKASRREAAIAYVSDDCPIAFRRGDLLITDASDASLRGGRTSARFLARAVDAGVDVRSHERLHAKVLLLDSRAVVGSANASRTSETLVEAVAVVSDSAFCRNVAAWMALLAQKSRRGRQGISPTRSRDPCGAFRR